jgi:hypothetical protein
MPHPLEGISVLTLSKLMFISIQTINIPDVNSRLWTLGPTTKVNDIKMLLKITTKWGENQFRKEEITYQDISSIHAWKETGNNGILPINDFWFQSIFQ